MKANSRVYPKHFNNETQQTNKQNHLQTARTENGLFTLQLIRYETSAPLVEKILSIYYESHTIKSR